MGETVIWGIHGGKSGDADTLFLSKGYIGIGWADAGDLSKVADREGFKALAAKTWPDRAKQKPLWVVTTGGQMFRFIKVMKTGDLVAYPSKRDRKIHIGRVEDEYRYDPSVDPGYPNLRKVKWLDAVPRTHFSQGALYEIGSALSLFQIKNYADEYRAVAEGKAVAQVASAKEDTSIVAVKQDVEETTRDFIVKALAQETKGHPFATFVAHVLNTMGYRTRVSPEGTDGGIDIVAHRDELGFEPPIVKVQVKSTEGKVGDPEVSALYGKVGSTEFGLVVTLGYFSPQAITFARNKSNLRLIDGDELVELILEHYEQLDSKYKAMVPLKRVYVPEPADENDE
ncbi:MAG TPA: restriction endonuclease [Polyangia bacterium]|nr:restriction endonuclease [Polyangia bacterium]